jgi:hypothetical protein
VVVVRRDDRHLQLGLESPHRVVLSDAPEIRGLLDALERGATTGGWGPAAAQALERLAQADLLVPPAGTEQGGTAVALSGPRTLVEAAGPALRAAGITVLRGPARPEDVRVLLAHGALSRDLADPLVRDAIPHLPVVVTPWGWELGPFVLAGATACLRCVDAAQADHDPRYGVVLDQVARTTPSVTSSPALRALALGWVARDLVAYGRGDRPSTWSATVRLAETPDEEPVSERRWLRHPLCGCAWDALTG